MIIGTILHNKNQILNQQNAIFNEALNIIKNSDFSILDDARYEVDGPNFYYILTTYKTKKPDEKPYAEVHRKYIDFQYIIYGEELVGYTDPKCAPKTNYDYNCQEDLELYSNLSDEHFFLVKKDMFTVFYPYEIHRPGLTENDTRSVRKIIFKILAKDGQ